ncbi:MAG: hypothetical protein ACR2IJ_02505 [Fluviibacter sp.]
MVSHLGIYASQISGHLTPSTGYVSIATIKPSSTNTLTFSAIPNSYKHLQLRYLNISSALANDISMRINGDTASNYASHYLYGGGSGSAAAGGAGSLTNMYSGYTGNTSSPAVGIIDILDYTSTIKNKTIRTLSGVDNNGSGYNLYTSGVWINTAAINSITLNTTATFQANSIFSLYGIQG